MAASEQTDKPKGIEFYGGYEVSSESGVGNYDQILAQSVERTVFSQTVHLLSADALIAAKKAAGGNKGQSHLLELIELKKMLDAAGARGQLG